MLTNKLKYVIIQAGGKGTRLEHYTRNKPKALVPINGKPNIFHLMSKFKNAKFIIIGDYKAEMFKNYLEVFCNFEYVFIHATEKGTLAGISEALSYIPLNTPFMITWCDLFVTNNFLPKQINKNTNYIGLSNNLFKCRWKFTPYRTIIERASYIRGIAGMFIFASKEQLGILPRNGEFCAFLRDKNILFVPMQLRNVYEFGTEVLYEKLKLKFTNSRSFNELHFTNKYVTKIPLNIYGKKIIKLETKWYLRMSNYGLTFIPKHHASDNTLSTEKINGIPLFLKKLDNLEKKSIILSVVEMLSSIHRLVPSKPSNVKNDYEAIIFKTKNRLDLISSVIPHIDSNHIVINDKQCINFYKDWSIVENLFKMFSNSRYTPIHGDPTFSNILITKSKKLFLIDPRGYYGKREFYGDPDYDWAKLLYSIDGNYDQLNYKNFELSLVTNDIKFKIESAGWEYMRTYFFDLINVDSLKIDFYQATIWLSYAQYVSEDYDAMLTAFYKGLELMQGVYEKSHK